jgi:hypothetical protein
MRLAGISAKKQSNAKVGQTLERYFGNNLAAQIPNRENPRVTYTISIELIQYTKKMLAYFMDLY